MTSENEKLRRELRLLRFDHEQLLASTDIKDQLDALAEQHAKEIERMSGLLNEREAQIERLKEKLRRRKDVNDDEENVNETPFV